MENTVRIGAKEITQDGPPYLIAEIGVNHDGSMDRALDLIWKAARCGADAVKFQAYKADLLAHPNSPTYFGQTGPEAKSQHEFFKRYDSFGPKEYERLAQECKTAQVDFLCTPFDLSAVEWLNPLVPAWKIASADITNIPLFSAITLTRKPVLLSTGAATLREIGRALQALYQQRNDAIALLHCVLAYPTPPEDANLLMIADLKHRFADCVIGYSDHTPATPEMEVCTMAYLMGARIIEKHFTDDKTRPGNDHAHSMDYVDLGNLRMALDHVGYYMGRGQKGPLPIEAAARRFARRGLYAAQDLSPGTQLRLEHVAILRPSANIGPEEWHRLEGKTLVVPMKKGEPFSWGGLAA